MPIAPRPGVFQGQIMNEWKWYVVDPAAGDPEVVRKRWDADYAKTNSPRWQRIFARIVPWSVFVVVSLIWILVATAIDVSVGTSNRAVGIVTVAIAGIIVSTILGILTANALYPTAVFPADRHPEVVGVPGAVEEWAAEEIPLDDLWALARQYYRVEELDEYDNEYPYTHPMPPWFAPQFEAFFAELAVSEYAALEAVAARVGFPIPPEFKPRSAR